MVVVVHCLELEQIASMLDVGIGKAHHTEYGHCTERSSYPECRVDHEAFCSSIIRTVTAIAVIIVTTVVVTVIRVL